MYVCMFASVCVYICMFVNAHLRQLCVRDGSVSVHIEPAEHFVLHEILINGDEV